MIIMRNFEKVTVRINVLFLFLLAINTFAEINPQFTTNRHLSNTRFNGLSNTGVAIPEAVSSILVNPSLIHNWHWLNKSKYSAVMSYERDSVFSRYIIGTGASWQINDVTTVGTLYRNMKNSDDNIQNDIIVCVAGRMFDKKFDQGAVNLGMNIRFENLDWKTREIDSLEVIQHFYSPKDTTHTTTKYMPVNYTSKMIKERRLLFDLGFFQDNIFKGLDFGLTFHNLFAYVWRSEDLTEKDTTWQTNDTTAYIDSVKDSSYYVNEWNDDNDRNNKVYKRMTVGISYHTNIIQNKIMLLLPFDLEFIGLFDRKQDIKLGLHTGLEGWLNDKICLRFGFAYSPNYISGKPGSLTIKNDKIFSGGAGVRFDRISFDVYIQKQDWGIGSAVSF